MNSKFSVGNTCKFEEKIMRDVYLLSVYFNEADMYFEKDRKHSDISMSIYVPMWIDIFKSRSCLNFLTWFKSLNLPIPDNIFSVGLHQLIDTSGYFNKKKYSDKNWYGNNYRCLLRDWYTMWIVHSYHTIWILHSYHTIWILHSYRWIFRCTVVQYKLIFDVDRYLISIDIRCGSICRVWFNFYMFLSNWTD